MASAEVELVQKQKGLVLIRCPVCTGLRGVTKAENASKTGICRECRRGNVIPRTQYHNYWLERFSREELREMARAIWE